MAREDLTRREFLDAALAASAGLHGIARPAMGLGGSPLDAAPSEGQQSGCPKLSPPAKTLYALRITHLDTLGYDEPYQNQPDERLPLACLQGLVNRILPEIYWVFDRHDEMGALVRIKEKLGPEYVLVGPD